MSIGKAQAAAIADGFLDSLGSEPDAFEPRETFTELILIAGGLAESAVNNLNNSNSNASGKLSESITAHEPVLVGKTLTIDVTMNFYGKFINAGVKGTKSGRSTAGYAFKNDMPSKSMVKALKEWIDRGKISTRNVKKYKAHGRHETKNRKLASLSELDKAYAVARSVKQHGIKTTGFMDKAIVETQKKVGSVLGQALKVDIINSIIN